MNTTGFRLLLTVFFLVSILPSHAELKSTLLEKGRAAEAAENYQQALEYYQQALLEDPQDPEPARALAELYGSKGLYDLALPVWQDVTRRSPGDTDAWIALGQTWSFLDNNKQSVETLNEAFHRFPANADVVQALAWMLFKTEEFQRGIAMIEGFVPAHGTDKGLEMTLGTLYSSVLDYDRSRVHYLNSIKLAEGRASGLKNFRSIAWYNLSLLEKSFYRFDLAEEAIRKSLEEEDRPAGSLAWGELLEGRRDFLGARRLYEKAVSADETPLGRFDLARLLLQSGDLEGAEAQLSLVENHKDDSWIYNYGVTKDKIKRDLEEVRTNLHRARYFWLDFQPRDNPVDWITWLSAKAKELGSWWYHDQSWKALLVRLSESSIAASNSPEAWVGLTLANRDRPALGLKYLNLVRNHEVPRNPKALASYLVEEGIMTRSPERLAEALTKLQVPGENEDRERTLNVLTQIAREKGHLEAMRQLLVDWYQLNPGGLPAEGFGLPIRWSVYGEGSSKQLWTKSLETFALQSGWDASDADRKGVLFSLEIRAQQTSAIWTLRGADGQAVRSGSVNFNPTTTLAAVGQVFRALHGPGR